MQFREDIAATITPEAVLPRFAKRVAVQLLLKCEEIDLHCAREAASHACRLGNPRRWAKRYLEELHQTR